MSSRYVGRFAPSPTGPLHFGSMIAAIGSFLDARAASGQWLLRIEDVDAPRCSAASEQSIIETLQHFGLEWDGPVTRQSHREARYREILEQLKCLDAVFACACTRRELELAQTRTARDGSRLYPGTCRNGLTHGKQARAWRFRVEGTVSFEDRIQGAQRENLNQESGDFVVLRADGFFAYQLAVVVDDADSGITHIVRGTDLLDSTGRQLQLQQTLGFPSPDYAHLPVATNEQGEKLSKQTLARAINDIPPPRAWLAVLQFLGQNPPVELQNGSIREITDWAISNWRPEVVPRCRTRVAPPAFLNNISVPERQT